MATVARIESSLNLNDAEFTAGIARAERRAQTFGARMEKTLERAFRRDPGRRAESAITGGLMSLARGDVAGAVDSIAGKVAGLGVAAGVGIGLAVEGFVKFRTQIKATHDAQEALSATLSRPLELNVEAGNATQLIADLKRDAENLDKTVNSDWGNVVSGLKNTYLRNPFDRREENREAAESQQKSNRAFIQAKVAAQLAGARELGLARGKTDPTDTGRLTEIFNKFREREAGIKLSPDKGTKDRLEALRLEEEFLTDQVMERTEARDREFASAKKLVALQASSLPDETKKKVAAQLRIKDIDEELKGRTLTTEQRQKLELERAQQGAVLSSGAPRAFSRYGGIAERERAEDQAQGSLVRRHIEGALGFGGFARRGLDEGDYKTPEQALLATGEASKAEIDRYREVVGDLPQGGVAGDLLNELKTLNSNFTKYWGGN